MYKARYLTDSNKVLKVLGSVNDGQVLQLAVVQNKLFVVHMRGNAAQVEVYDTAEFIKKDFSVVSGVTNSTSLAACQRYNCLYVGNVQPERIYRVDPSTETVVESPKINSSYWPVYRPSGLSVTREGNLVVTFSHFRVNTTLFPTRIIREYTPDGKHKLAEIELKEGVEPWHAIKLSSGQFVVNNVGTVDKVHVVEATGVQCVQMRPVTGRIVHSHGGTRGPSDDQMNDPRYLAVDSHDNVLVADCYNNRVVLLSSTLAYLGRVATPEHQLISPRALYLDEPNDRLYIGELSGRILVVNLPPTSEQN